MSISRKLNKLVCADESLLKLWGKPLSNRDAEICGALGWAEQVDGDTGPMWQRASFDYPFDGAVYINGAVAEYRCDDRLLSHLLERQLTCLDRFFGRGTGYRIHYRCLLTLIDLVLLGNAECIRGGNLLMFVANAKLNEIRLSSNDVARVGDTAAGEVVIITDKKGDEVAMLTPFAFFSALNKALIDEAMLNPVVDELERRGLVRRPNDEFSDEAIIVTTKGVNAGLRRMDIPVIFLIAELGLDPLFAQIRAKLDLKAKNKGFH